LHAHSLDETTPLSSSPDSLPVLFALLLLRQKQPAHSLQILEGTLALAEAKGKIWLLIELLSLQALSLQAQDNTSAAVTILARALSLAVSEKYIRTFISKGPLMQLLLRRVSSHVLVASYANTLLAAFGETSPLSSHSLTEPLTEREFAILKLLSSGLSNREIAQSLVLAPGTVKWYVNSIYSKLDVHHRVQAISRARSLKLLPPS
jgi:LuxR family maltose regulon positive regulatory protein